MLEYLTLGQFVVALLMGLAALCAFVWGAASGALSDVERVKYRILEIEGDPDPRVPPTVAGAEPSAQPDAHGTRGTDEPAAP